MFNFLAKKTNLLIGSPVNGTSIPLDKVNDPVFAQKLMGDGIAVCPITSDICAVTDGEIILIPSTHHAYGIRTVTGDEILVHIGIDTVTLQGKGFTPLVKEGTQVKKGKPIIHVDLNILKENQLDNTVMVILTEAATNHCVKEHVYGEVKTGSTIYSL